jgi:hypothetical protein
VSELNSDEEFFGGEKLALGHVMHELMAGKTGAFVEFLSRGRAISPGAAYFVGQFIGSGFGDYEFQLKRKTRRGAPRGTLRKTQRGTPRTASLTRARNAALWVHWTVNKPNPGRHNPKREEAIIRAARHFHVDRKRVGEELKFFERWPAVHPREFRRKLLQTATKLVVEI